MKKSIYLYPSDKWTYFRRTVGNKKYKVHFTGYDEGSDGMKPFIIQAAENTPIEVDDIIIEILAELGDASIIDALSKYKGKTVKFSDTFWRKIIMNILKTAKQGKDGKEFPILSLYISDNEK